MNLKKIFDARQTNTNRDAEYLKASAEYPDNFYLKLAAKAVRLGSSSKSVQDMSVDTMVLGNKVYLQNKDGIFSIYINGKPAYSQKGYNNLIENTVLGILDKEYAGDININRPNGRTIDSERREWAKMEKDGYSLPFDKLLAVKAKEQDGKTKGTNYKLSPWLSEKVFMREVARTPDLKDYFDKVTGFPLYLPKHKSLVLLKNKQVIMPDGKLYPLDDETFRKVLTSSQIDEILARNKALNNTLSSDGEKFIAINDKDVYRIYLNNDEWVFTKLNLNKA